MKRKKTRRNETKRNLAKPNEKNYRKLIQKKHNFIFYFHKNWLIRVGIVAITVGAFVLLLLVFPAKDRGQRSLAVVVAAALLLLLSLLLAVFFCVCHDELGEEAGEVTGSGFF